MNGAFSIDSGSGAHHGITVKTGPPPTKEMPSCVPPPSSPPWPHRRTHRRRRRHRPCVRPERSPAATRPPRPPHRPIQLDEPEGRPDQARSRRLPTSARSSATRTSTRSRPPTRDSAWSWMSIGHRRRPQDRSSAASSACARGRRHSRPLLHSRPPGRLLAPPWGSRPAWGVVAALDGGSASLPWLVRRQGPLPQRPAPCHRPDVAGDGCSPPVPPCSSARSAAWTASSACTVGRHPGRPVFAALHWLIEMSDDVIQVAVQQAREASTSSAASTSAAATPARSSEFPSTWCWRWSPPSGSASPTWRHLHRSGVLPSHAAVLAPPDHWTQPVGVLLALLLAAARSPRSSR